LAAVAGKTIVIDPGHNGANGTRPDVINRPVDIGTQERACDTTGAATNDGYTESEYNLDVALRLAEPLRAAGANVVLTRSDDTGVGPCIDERAAIGNRAAADVAISLHADGGPGAGRGFHLIFPPSIPGLTDDIADASRELALDVRAAYLEGTGVPYADYIANEGLSERSDLGGTNLSDVPKVFIETGNMRNEVDAALLKDAGFRQQAAEAIADGLARYLGRSPTR
jgi:N-acetylmuramoyl-L-alanine amidase